MGKAEGSESKNAAEKLASRSAEIRDPNKFLFAASMSELFSLRPDLGKKLLRSVLENYTGSSKTLAAITFSIAGFKNGEKALPQYSDPVSALSDPWTRLLPELFAETENKTDLFSRNFAVLADKYGAALSRAAEEIEDIGYSYGWKHDRFIEGFENLRGTTAVLAPLKESSRIMKACLETAEEKLERMKRRVAGEYSMNSLAEQAAKNVANTAKHPATAEIKEIFSGATFERTDEPEL